MDIVGPKKIIRRHGRSSRADLKEKSAVEQALDYNIAFFTNTYLPFVGGVALSTNLYQRHLSRLGAKVIVYAPRYEGAEDDGDEVRRLPAIRHFYKSDFSFPLPISLKPGIDFTEACFDVVHVHHPFLLGEMGMRIARQYRIPLVFTYHTQYEKYTHYVPIPDDLAQRTIVRHTREFCDLCDMVIAPTEDVKGMLLERGVKARVEVLPTGIEMERFKAGDRQALRRELNLHRDDVILLHVGRLAREKNLAFLLSGALKAMSADPRLHLAIAGDGDFGAQLKETAKAAGEPGARVHFLGRRHEAGLIDVYAGGDLFLFASKTETQGMVVAEAMAAGTPAVALDADGVRHVVRNEKNGLLLNSDAAHEAFADAILYAMSDRARLAAWRRSARRTAAQLDMPVLASRLLHLYHDLKAMPNRRLKTETMSFGLIRNYFETIWEQVENWLSRI